MKTYVLSFKDFDSGLPLDIKAEITDFQDIEAPEVVICDISYYGRALNQDDFSGSFYKRVENEAFRRWCNE